VGVVKSAHGVWQVVFGTQSDSLKQQIRSSMDSPRAK